MLDSVALSRVVFCWTDCVEGKDRGSLGFEKLEIDGEDNQHRVMTES